MDEETKAFLLARIETMESLGLDYQQQGEIHRSRHFDLNPLKQALEQYIGGYNGDDDDWYATRNLAAIEAAWMVVGKANGMSPHVAQEYCRPDVLLPLPSSMLIGRIFLKKHAESFSILQLGDWGDDSWFPLGVSSNSGLGFNFALMRGRDIGRAANAGVPVPAPIHY